MKESVKANAERMFNDGKYLLHKNEIKSIRESLGLDTDLRVHVNFVEIEAIGNYWENHGFDWEKINSYTSGYIWPSIESVLPESAKVQAKDMMQVWKYQISWGYDLNPKPEREVKHRGEHMYRVTFARNHVKWEQKLVTYVKAATAKEAEEAVLCRFYYRDSDPFYPFHRKAESLDRIPAFDQSTVHEWMVEIL